MKMLYNSFVTFKNYMKFLLLISTIIIGALSCTNQNVKSSKKKTYHLNEFNELLNSNIANKQIVMLADGYHGHRSYQDILLNYLESWLSNITDNPKFQPKKLLLILEIDSLYSLNLNNYFLTGELDDILQYNIDMCSRFGGWEKFTIDNLDFISKLKIIENKIRTLQNNGNNHKIDLKIVGFEENSPVVLNGNQYNSFEERFRWFAHKRDKTLSKTMQEFIDFNDDYKVLIFYGDAHLIREYVDKTTFVGLSNEYEKASDYFLAHFLDEIYGRDNISIFSTNKVFDKNEERIEELTQNEDSPDFISYIKVYPANPFPFYFLSTKKTLNVYFTISEMFYNNKNRLYIPYLNILNNFLLRSYMADIKENFIKLEYLQKSIFDYKNDPSLFKKNFEIYSDLIRDFDDIENLREMEKWILGKELSDNQQYINSLKMIVYNIKEYGKDKLEIKDLSKVAYNGFLTQEEKEYVKNKIEIIKQYTAMNFTELDQLIDNNKVGRYLEEITNQKLTNKKDWESWLRKRIMNDRRLSKKSLIIP